MKCPVTMLLFFSFGLVNSQDVNKGRIKRYYRIQLLLKQELERIQFIDAEQRLIISTSDRNTVRNCLQTFN